RKELQAAERTSNPSGMARRLGVRRVVGCHADWECPPAAIPTLRKATDVEESGGHRMLHRQRTLHAARATRTFPSNHGMGLLDILVRGQDVLKTIPQNIPDRFQRITSGENVAIRYDKHLKESENTRRLF